MKGEQKMDIKTLIARFEAEIEKVQRPGIDKLMAYIRKSDFYEAPASTKYHLSCEGGLLQHSLNVLDALRGSMTPTQDGQWEYRAAGTVIDTIPDESVLVMALLHDICKTYFYTVSLRNAKNEQTGKWEKVPYFSVKDRMPLGHGDKSVMIIKQYIELSNREMYAIWWHMGYTDTQDTLALGNAIEMYPAVWALHNADMMASRMMEDDAGNKEPFAQTDVGQAPDVDNSSAGDAEPVFEEAPSYGS